MWLCVFCWNIIHFHTSMRFRIYSFAPLLATPLHSTRHHSCHTPIQRTKRSNAIQLHNVFISFIFSSHFYLISWPFSPPFVCGKNGNYAVYVFYWLHSFDCFMFRLNGAFSWDLRRARDESSSSRWVECPFSRWSTAFEFSMRCVCVRACVRAMELGKRRNYVLEHHLICAHIIKYKIK